MNIDQLKTLSSEYLNANRYDLLELSKRYGKTLGLKNGPAFKVESAESRSVIKNTFKSKVFSHGIELLLNVLQKDFTPEPSIFALHAFLHITKENYKNRMELSKYIKSQTAILRQLRIS